MLNANNCYAINTMQHLVNDKRFKNENSLSYGDKILLEDKRVDNKK